MKRLLFTMLIFLLAISVKAQDSRWGNALQFDGTDYVTVNTIPGALVGKDFSIEFWFKLNATPTDFNALAVFNPPSADATDNRIETGVGYGSNQKFYLYSPNSSPDTNYGSTTIAVNTWYHVAITYTYSTGAAVVYLNGTQELTKTIPVGDRIQFSDRFSLGQEWDNSTPSALLKGEIDEVSIWNDIRTSSEIKTNMYTPLVGTEANLLAYYKMSDGSGTSLTDDSPNTYTGSLVNGTAWVTSTVPHPYSGGTGTLGDPYKIATEADLIYVSQHNFDWSKYFLQTANIIFNADETQVDWDASGSVDGSGTAGFSPIGNSTTKFTGNYNGTGHTIRNLFINFPGAGETTGLFGQTNGSTISNVGLVDAAVTGGYDTGILAGNSSTSSISIFNNCYSTGIVNGVNNVGGLIGLLNNQSVMNNCYSLANVGGSINIGGLVGAFYTVSQVNNCYSAGLVTASGTSGGLIGNKDGSGTVTNSFWDVQTSKKSTSAEGTGLTTAQMKVQSSFTNWDFTAGMGKWAIKSGDYISYPYLQEYSYDTPGTTPAVNPISGLEDAHMILSYTVTAGATIGLPLYGTVSVTVDWGDGSSAETVNTAGFKYHTYTNAGTYAVKISGTLTHFGNEVLQPNAHPEYLISVTSFGSIGLSSLDYAFMGAANLTDIPNTLPASVTSLSYTFKSAEKLNDADISSWNVSQVTNMSGLFLGASIFNQPIGSWNVNSVQNMKDMFSMAHAFNQDITSWNVANVTNMSNMFYDAWNFNQSISS